MLHDTDKGVVICNSSRGDEIRVLRPLQEYSWKIRILSLPRLCQTRGHEEVFLGICSGEVIVSCSLCTYLLGPGWGGPPPEGVAPTEGGVALHQPPHPPPPRPVRCARRTYPTLHGRRPSTSKRLRFRP